MEWPPLRENVNIIDNYNSLLDVCINVSRGDGKAVILVRNVDELVKIKELPPDCIMLIKPDNGNNSFRKG
ncbi:MAG: hypothetical protein GSR85_03670 [Desulfurococcales archaeon]|nr:hypothetical protein [Desulfurococcales archaeon]